MGGNSKFDRLSLLLAAILVALGIAFIYGYESSLGLLPK
jgi:uncharacterized protein (UPF0333 family)